MTAYFTPPMKIYRTANGGGLCPFCGAYSSRSCELEEDMGSCLWEDSEPDPDLLRDDAHERQRMEMEYPDDE
ncbi:hypothetical protein [Xanthobacter versatilis]|uniref:hypothetical protein n=1 Tax=Xanthobacter autotrophicus (strain ATCC BAA-1158 / Py2) TaxID=78245 RepID=UPI003729A1BE